MLDPDVIPGIPVVVIKECERIVIPLFPSYSDNKNPEYINNGFPFKFSDVYYDNINPAPVNNPYQSNITKLEEAWVLNGRTQNLGWQRDHIYYSINPNNPNGPFINNHQEQITSFKIEGSNGYNAIGNIADPSSVSNPLNDPGLIPVVIQGSNPSLGSFWTDGKFDFNVYLSHGAKSGTNLLTKTFDATPQDLFNIQYQKVGVFSYTITSISSKALNKFIPLLTWRLEDYSNQWSIRIEEVDMNVEHTDTSTQTVKYNANFGIEPSEGILKKLGMKFGASLEDTQSKSWVAKYTETSEDLGEVSINFGDNVIIGNGAWFAPYIYRQYSSAKYTITVRPVKVQ